MPEDYIILSKKSLELLKCDMRRACRKPRLSEGLVTSAWICGRPQICAVRLVEGNCKHAAERTRFL